MCRAGPSVRLMYCNHFTFVMQGRDRMYAKLPLYFYLRVDSYVFANACTFHRLARIHEPNSGCEREHTLTFQQTYPNRQRSSQSSVVYSLHG